VRTKAPQVSFHAPVDNLRLAISLGVKGSAEVQLGSLSCPEFPLKIIDEQASLSDTITLGSPYNL